MKNEYCKLSQEEIHALPNRFKGFLLSPFQFNLRGGMVAVPEDTFTEMIEIIAEYAAQAAHAGADTDLETQPLSDVLELNRIGDFTVRIMFNNKVSCDKFVSSATEKKEQK